MRDLLKKRAKDRAFYNRRRAAQLCVKCRKPVIVFHTECRICIEKKRTRNARYLKKKAGKNG